MDNILKGLDLSEEELTALEAVLDVPPEEVDQAIEQAKSILQGVLVNKSEDTLDEFVQAFLAEKTNTVEETPEENDLYVEFRDRLFKDLNVEGLQEALVMLANRQTAVEESVEKLGTEVQEVKQDDDLKIAATLAGGFIPAPDWKTYVNKQQEEIEDDELIEQLKGNIPEYVETEAGKDNPLNIGFTQFMWGQPQN